MNNSKEQTNIEKDEANNVNEKLNKMISYNNINQNELREHLNLIKK